MNKKVVKPINKVSKPIKQVNNLEGLTIIELMDLERETTDMSEIYRIRMHTNKMRDTRRIQKLK